jgi:hypothetical protein
VPKRVGNHARAIKRLAVAIAQRRQRGDPAAHDPAELHRRHRRGAARVALKAREQPQLTDRGVGVALADPPLLGRDQLGGLLVDR